MKAYLLIFSVIFSLPLAVSANDTPPYTANNQAGTQGSPSQADQIKKGMSDDVAENHPVDNRAKTELAPHSVLVQTELQTALDQTEGMKMQLEAISDKPDKDALDHL